MSATSAMNDHGSAVHLAVYDTYADWETGQTPPRISPAPAARSGPSAPPGTGDDDRRSPGSSPISRSTNSAPRTVPC